MEPIQGLVAIVDNDAMSLLALRLLIEKYTPYAVAWTCPNGEAALAQVAESSLDIQALLLDMALCGIPGTQVCQQIRMNGGQFPILAITSYPLERYAEAACQAGAQGIVSKSDFKSMVNSISLAIKWRRTGRRFLNSWWVRMIP